VAKKKKHLHLLPLLWPLQPPPLKPLLQRQPLLPLLLMQPPLLPQQRLLLSKSLKRKSSNLLRWTGLIGPSTTLSHKKAAGDSGFFHG
jgi:hypothetical protein